MRGLKRPQVSLLNHSESTTGATVFTEQKADPAGEDKISFSL